MPDLPDNTLYRLGELDQEGYATESLSMLEVLEHVGLTTQCSNCLGGKWVDPCDSPETCDHSEPCESCGGRGWTVNKQAARILARAEFHYSSRWPDEDFDTIPKPLRDDRIRTAEVSLVAVVEALTERTE